jgi:hypothetical protein
MCPTEAITLYLLPKNLLMVFALEGDSTITSDLLAAIGAPFAHHHFPSI